MCKHILGNQLYIHILLGMYNMIILPSLIESPRGAKVLKIASAQQPNKPKCQKHKIHALKSIHNESILVKIVE